MRKILLSLFCASVMGLSAQTVTPDGKPVMRPLLEEFTGLWCSFCPRGYVAMETLKEEYPNNFIGLAYHNNDAMSNVAGKPFSPSSYPEIHLNRQSKAIEFSQIYSLWPEEVAKEAPAWVDVKAEWGDDEHNIINATVTVCFTEDHADVDYGISAVLVVDGMSNTAWHQKNGLVGAYDDPTMQGYWGELFTHGTNPMDGLVFNDVVICNNDLHGDTKTIPADVTAGQEYVYTTSFDLAHSGALGRLAQTYRDNVRVVGLLLGRNPKSALNSNTSVPMGQLEIESGDPSEDTALEHINADCEVISTTYHDVQGRQLLDNDIKGIVIKTETLSNGRTIVTKQVR